MKIMLEFTIQNVSDIRRITDSLHCTGDETVVDLSEGCDHIREIAEESGMEWEAYWSNQNKFLLNGREVETWYDENSSSPRAWCGFIKGIGNFRSYSLEEVLLEMFEKIGENHGLSV